MTLDDILIDRYVVVTSTRHPWAYCCRGRIVAFDLDARTVMLFIEKDHGDCEFITFFVHEVELAVDEPLFAEPVDGWADHKLQDLSSIAHLYPPPPPRRPLSSLSNEEAAEVYRLAFPGSEATLIDRISTDLIYIESHMAALRIERSGDVSTMAAMNEDYSVAFNAVAVVRFLDKLGIQLG